MITLLLPSHTTAYRAFIHAMRSITDVGGVDADRTIASWGILPALAITDYATGRNPFKGLVIARSASGGNTSMGSLGDRSRRVCWLDSGELLMFLRVLAADEIQCESITRATNAQGSGN